MIPNTLLSTELEIAKQPSKTYRMNIDTSTVNGMCDGLEAVKQSIYKILNTERYQYLIYSWNYGVELVDLIGEPVTYACPEIQRRITEALLQDDRIESVSEFEFDTSAKHEVVCTFVVRTIFGDVDGEKVVKV